MNRDGRFAPSPTGHLHLGNLRTALLAWLFARSQDSAFRMRIEDLDSSRVRPGLSEQQLADLAAIGIDWDGEVVRQSERIPAYESAVAGLERDGRVYPCFCTRAEIRAAASAPHGPAPEGAYPGTCRHLDAQTRAELLAAGRSPALRLRADGVAVEFEDRLRGRIRTTIDDFVLRRNDGAYAYNLAVVVDDAAQGVGEVVRGDDLLSSTGRQLHLAAALGLAAPSHAHVPLVLGPDGSRLAKRHGSVTLRDTGVAEAMNWIAGSLGSPGGGRAGDLLARFDPTALPTEPSVYAPRDQRSGPETNPEGR
ncbi:MAG: tRNA glutamyl-Q(34) synthetase GluQRS [Solirubrobacterales bacterium]|nr:tRNA glutamyl-Q(34) synthetase GluQRS [Solirubrobacterales bacterium]